MKTAGTTHISLLARLVALVVIVGGLASCSRDDAAARRGLQPGIWRAVLASPGGDLPFGLEIEDQKKRWAAWIRNGEELIRIPKTSVADRRIVFDITHYDAKIEAELSADGRSMSGAWTKTVGGGTSRLDFAATFGAAPRFAVVKDKPRSPKQDISGRWRVRFAKSDDDAIGEFVMKPNGGLTGTFLTTTGDYRFLAGNVQGASVHLSVFDGAHAFLFRATIADDGSLRGDFWSRDVWHEAWHATRDDDVELADAFKQTTWVDGVALSDLEFPDLDGNVRSLGDEVFAGKARILHIFGSWCPNCHDASEYMTKLHRRYASKGLSVVGLAFEVTDDFDRNVAQVKTYVDKHGIGYPVLMAGPANKKEATKAFRALDFVRSYPTTVFLRADGSVHSIHSGFTGPATGKAYDDLKTKFESTIESLLNS